jgi:hypothetical protein
MRPVDRLRSFSPFTSVSVPASFITSSSLALHLDWNEGVNTPRDVSETSEDTMMLDTQDPLVENHEPVSG